MKKNIDGITKEEFVDRLSKSMYKAVQRYLTNKDDTKDIVSDILDDNYVAEVDPDEVKGTGKTNVTRKSEVKSSDLLKKEKKGVYKLKRFISLKKQGNSNL